MAQYSARGYGHVHCIFHYSNIVFACKTCDGELVCMECVTSSHQHHSFEKIADSAINKKTVLENYLQEAENTILPNLTFKLKLLEEEITRNSTKFDVLANQIISQGEKVKSEIDKITQDLVLESRTIGQNNQVYLLQHRKKLKHLITKVKDRQDKCKVALESNDNIKVIDMERMIPTEFHQPKFPQLQTVAFTAGKFNKKHLAKQTKMLGFLTIKTANLIISEFSHPGMVKSIERSASNCVWVSCWDEKYISLVNHVGDMKSKVEMSNKVCDISLSPMTGNLWVYCLDSTVYEMLDTPCKRFTARPNPICMCVTSRGTVVVGNEQELTQYSNDGKLLQTQTSKQQFQMFQYMNRQQGLVIAPFSIKSCHTGDIAVCDNDWSKFGGMNRPHVTVFNSDLSVKHRYYGTQTSKVTTDFHPFDSVFDLQGRLLIADYNNKCIQLVSGEGTCIESFSCDQLKPISITLVGDDGYMFVAFQHKIIRVFDYNS